MKSLHHKALQPEIGIMEAPKQILPPLIISFYNQDLGAQAGTNTSYFLGQIGTSPITKVEVMGSSNVGNQYERYEIGVNISNYPLNTATDYITPISNFINDPANPGIYSIWSPSNLSGKLDPYDPNQVKIEADFTNISSGNTYTRYGFYQETVSVTGGGTAYDIGIDNSFPFRIRFSPPEPGEWTVSIFLYINGILASGNQPYMANFNIQPTYNPAGIEVNPDPLFPTRLAYKGTGTMFVPIGQDIALADQFDPNLGSLYGTSLDGEDANNNAYSLQRGYITNLHENGGNFIRLRMDQFSNGIEIWVYTGTTYFKRNFTVNYL